MNLSLGLRTLLLLAVVLAATTALVHPASLGIGAAGDTSGASAGTAALRAVPAFGYH